MEPETPVPFASSNQLTPVDASATSNVSPEDGNGGGSAPQDRDFRWVFIGPQGLRAGWSAVLFIILFLVFTFAVGTASSAIEKNVFHMKPAESLTPLAGILGEGLGVIALLAAAGIMAKIERRRVADYYLRGSRSSAHFASGLAFGFLALSALVGVMTLGGWMHFGGMALSGGQIVVYAVLWAVAFTLVGCVEEGTFRCYMQYTLARGINFWWAAGVIGCMCLDLLLRARGNGVWGVYLMALLGLPICLWLHLSKTPRSGFWQAAWVTSTLFGYVHTGNNGENWIGIFAAAAIGFVFCVSVYVTGSAWWAIGCHAAWDWAETYFYGTADSGLVAKGHLLTSTPAGPAFWSGGTDGPEGSVLVLGVILLLLVAILAIYGRRRQAEGALAAAAAP
jgi:uncharacterized protein